MTSRILAQVFLNTEVKPLTTRTGDDLIAQFENMVLLVTPSSTDLKTVDVFQFTGFQEGGALRDTATLALINQRYQEGMTSYLRKVIKAGNAEHLQEPAKSYLLRYGLEIYSLPITSA